MCEAFCHSGICSVGVSRHLNDWELAEYENFLLMMATVHLVDKEDRIRWKLNKSGRFTVSYFYRYLTSGNGLGSNTFSFRTIWKANATPRITFLFAWEAAKECILTVENLMRRGRFMVHRFFFM